MDTERRVVFKNGRGAIVENFIELQKLVPGSLSVPANMAVNLIVYEFNITYRRISSVQWAKMWLAKGDKKCRQVGIFTPCDEIPKESKITIRKAKKEFYNDCKKGNVKKKLRRAGGAWSSSML